MTSDLNHIDFTQCQFIKTRKQNYHPLTSYHQQGDVCVFVDGACSRNGLPTARGGMGVYFPWKEYDNLSVSTSQFIKPPTNQSTELMAVYLALFSTLADTRPVRIFSDSLYAVNIMQRWGKRWLQQGLLESAGPDLPLPKANHIIVKDLLSIESSRRGPVYYHHIKGHIPWCFADDQQQDTTLLSRYNDQADFLARLGELTLTMAMKKIMVHILEHDQSMTRA